MRCLVEGRRIVQVLRGFDGSPLEVTRQQGYALDDEECEVGIRAVSAPVWNIDGNRITALGIAGPTNRIRLERIQEMAQALIETASASSAYALRR